MNYFSLGELVMDLAPEAERKNLRNSEGAFLRLENGDLIFIYSRFRDESAADAAASARHGSPKAARGLPPVR